MRVSGTSRVYGSHEKKMNPAKYAVSSKWARRPITDGRGNPMEPRSKPGGTSQRAGKGKFTSQKNWSLWKIARSAMAWMATRPRFFIRRRALSSERLAEGASSWPDQSEKRRHVRWTSPAPPHLLFREKGRGKKSETETRSW